MTLLLTLACTPFSEDMGLVSADRSDPEPQCVDFDQGEELELQLYAIGYSDFYADSFEPEDLVITSDEDYDAFLAQLQPVQGSAPEVDFEQEALFVHYWVDGGCSDPPEYAAWELDGGVRVSLLPHVSGNCDAWFQNYDLLVVPTGGSEDVDWCL